MTITGTETWEKSMKRQMMRCEIEKMILVISSILIMGYFIVLCIVSGGGMVR